ncbi:NAD(P)-dependent oxidoreductase [Nocardioidaceae bacterium]|nr:NAD(P)-dependent oxidoreductase [Nocardioidaceae bacterium]
MRVAVLGTGIMGRAMAANIAAAGHDTVVWNRTRDKAEGIKGTTVADSASGAVAGRDAVVTMLVDADTVLEVMNPDVLGAAKGAVWLQMSTVGEEVSRLAEAAADADIPFVDAPVAGTKAPAEQGELTVLASGPTDVRETADAVFDAVGKQTHWLGEDAGAGSRMKLLVNGVLVHQVAAVAEGVRGATALGLDPEQLLEVLDGGPLNSPVVQGKGKLMVGGSFDPQFPLEHAGKDARLLHQAAKDAGQDLPVLEAIAQLHADAVDAGLGREDMAAIVKQLD